MTSSTLVAIGPPLAVALIALVAVAVAMSALGRFGHERAIPVAALRAAAQLAALTGVLTALSTHSSLTMGFLALMSITAAATAARRVCPAAEIANRLRTTLVCLVPVVAPTSLFLSLLVAAAVVPARPLAVVPVAGILIGNAMSATSLAGRRARDELRLRAGEVDAALALGFGARDAALLVCRHTVAATLLPALDSAKTTGLVTFPGAFVGTMLAGAGAEQAGVVQLFIIIGLLAVQTTASALTMWLVADGRL